MDDSTYSANLSKTVVSGAGNGLYTFEVAATLTKTSVILIERFADLGLILAEERMVRLRGIARIAQLLRLRQDLELNWFGAGMVLDMAQEIAQLKAQFRAYKVYHNN